MMPQRALVELIQIKPAARARVMFLRSRFEHAIGRIFANGAVPLRLKLWNGRHIDLSSAPTVTVIIPKMSALRYFISPDLNKLGEAFVEGHTRVEGSIHEIFRVAESLARNVAAHTRAGFHRAARHSRNRDRKAIEFHYDVSNDFYSLFLDRSMVYSCASHRSENDPLELARIHVRLAPRATGPQAGLSKVGVC
ncbi:MAG: class I SAM-dependent methyltransferase [Burkholderiales bacterium]